MLNNDREMGLDYFMKVYMNKNLLVKWQVYINNIRKILLGKWSFIF